MTMLKRLCHTYRWPQVSAPATPRARPSESLPVAPLSSSSNAVDPHTVLKAEMAHVRSTLLDLLGSSDPTLSQIASYYFHRPSKQLCPLLVLLFSRATNGLGSNFRLKLWSAERSRLGAEHLDAPLSRPNVLNDFNPSIPGHTVSFCSPFDLRPPARKTYPPPPASLHTLKSDVLASESQLAHTVLPTQIRLAQIVELIHVASLLHDDVIDESGLRRGAPSAPAAFGDKLAVLGGNFLLGRASAALSRLGDNEVVELIAGVIANLVDGEILQLKGAAEEVVDLSSRPHADQPSYDAEVLPRSDRWNTYLRKTYLKTASLVARAARAAVVLGGCAEGEIWKEVAYAYGRNVGIAFQGRSHILVDDILDLSESPSESAAAALGKPGSGADLRLGLATGPVLYAAEEYPELEPLITRRFKHGGDVERALSLVRASSGISRTRDLARAHADKAREVIGVLPESEARGALEALTERVITRVQ